MEKKDGQTGRGTSHQPLLDFWGLLGKFSMYLQYPPISTMSGDGMGRARNC